MLFSFFIQSLYLILVIGNEIFRGFGITERCPREKGRYAEEITTLFLLSHDPVE